MKIFGIKPEDNDMADLENTRYINLALSHIEENIKWLKTTSKPTQAVLTHIDILVMLAKRFPIDANLLIQKARVIEWEHIFSDWFERAKNKIPSKYRDGIKENADKLFTELKGFGNSLPY